IAGIAGHQAPFAFLLASLMAGFTAISFAEMSARHPRAAGAALYVQRGFGVVPLAALVGLLVATAGVVSMSAMLNGFVGYLNEFVEVDRVTAIITATLVLGAIAAWGIAESVTIAAIITLIEVGGLVAVIFAGGDVLADLPSRWGELMPSGDFRSWGLIFAGAILAFYAYIGFEDMVDVAEEVRSVRRNLPTAILLTLGITTLLYLVLMTTAVLGMAPTVLATKEAPLAALYSHFTGGDGYVISLIGLFAIVNGALIQMIMASRVLYGLSSRGQLPKFLRRVNSRTHTPLIATALVTAATLVLATSGRLTTLAQATSIIMLTVFAAVNLALWRLKAREPHPAGVRTFPRWIPMVGFVVSAGFVLNEATAFFY
ncbi:MAG: APC family permease, partial [Gammaproteobacteria bacterium]